jgi:hypothetical protein
MAKFKIVPSIRHYDEIAHVDTFVSLKSDAGADCFVLYENGGYCEDFRTRAEAVAAFTDCKYPGDKLVSA